MLICCFFFFNNQSRRCTFSCLCIFSNSLPVSFSYGAKICLYRKGSMLPSDIEVNPSSSQIFSLSSVYPHVTRHQTLHYSAYLIQVPIPIHGHHLSLDCLCVTDNTTQYTTYHFRIHPKKVSTNFLKSRPDDVYTVSFIFV